jgi:hypothetical protein
VDAEKLAPALAAALEPVLPSDMDIDVSGTILRLGLSGTPWWSETDLGSWRTADLDATVEWVLDTFQTDIAEASTEPWPALAPGPMPEPFAEIRDGELLCGYGDPAAPILRLASIPLREIGGA